MASFSFGAGNAKKILQIPGYVLGRLATALIPRGERWAFGSAAGIADGALALWEHASAAGEETFWLTSSPYEDDEAKRRGIHTVRKNSLRGFWETARAGTIVVTHGFGDANRFAIGGARVVQLWHGIPLKRIGLDSPETLRSSILPNSALVRGLLAAMYRGANARIRVLPAASDLVRGRLESAFGLYGGQVVVTGEPRVDVLSRGTQKERAEQARRLLDSVLPDLPLRVILYAPTWRDGADDPAVPSERDWESILAALEKIDAALVIRSHPLGAGNYAAPIGSTRVRFLPSSVAPDITPYLAAFDGLITDYSSLAYDAGLVALPVFFLAPDVEDYAGRRGFYGSYAEVSGGAVSDNWHELGETLVPAFLDEERLAAHRQRSEQLSMRVHAFRDGRNTERIYRRIVRQEVGDR